VGGGDIKQRLARAGGGIADEVAPEVLTVDVVNAWSDREERVLRLQHEEKKLPARYEAELRTFDSSTMTGALRRWALLKHLYRVRSEGLEARASASPEAEEAARKLLRREPEIVWLAGHRVEVTGRSYSAMAEIAAHAMRIATLEVERQGLWVDFATTQAVMKATRVWDRLARKALKESMRDLSDAYARVSTEHELHRRSLYAHALTPDGAPSRSPVEDAPEWWREVGPDDDVKLLAALFKVGPGRYTELGDPPRPREEASTEFLEDLGYASLFRVWEPKMGLKPAGLYDVDLAQFLTAARASATESPEADA